ncbi:Rho guanine nucleotide exchange factor 3, partial [Spiromyces aspiralis]
MSLRKAVHNEEFLHLASAFASLANNISIYTSYCAHYQQHHLALDALRADPHWRKFMQDFQSRITLEPDHRRLELCDYFIMPVQRLCRYPLLLKEITRHTPPFAPEYKYLEASLKTMTSVCSRINAGKRNHESIELTRRFILGCKGTK